MIINSGPNSSQSSTSSMSHNFANAVAGQRKNTNIRGAMVASNCLCKIPWLSYKRLHISDFMFSKI